ncbi:MAG: PAS domain S-box protein [Candidatus Hydrogenedentes bacterium]|nr:PAS domain S-box protein [Candidatus Hydrogenedentota bacterium]
MVCGQGHAAPRPMRGVAIRIVLVIGALWLTRAAADILNVYGYLPFSTVMDVTTVCDLCLCAFVAYHTFVCFSLLKGKYLIVLMTLGCALVVTRSLLRAYPETSAALHLAPHQLTQLADGVIANGGALVLAGSFCFILLSLRNMVIRMASNEQQLKESEERFRLLFEQAPDGYFITDLNGVFVDGNQASEQLIGYSREELIGKSYADVQLIHADSVTSTDVAMERNRVGSDTGPNEYTLVRKDGVTIDVEVRAHPAVHRGNPVLLGIARDITDRKRAQRALLESERRYRGLVEQTQDLIIRMTTDGKIAFINAASEPMIGYSPEELIGQPVSRFLSESTVRQLEASMARRLSGKLGDGPLIQVIELRRKDGLQYFGEVRSIPIADAYGVITEFQGVIRDISDRKRAEEERRELDRRMLNLQKLESLGVLAGGIAHDFNNLLLLVLGYADLALKELSPTSPARDSIREIEDAACRAADLCRQMLAYSGRGKFVMQTIHPNRLVEEMTHLLRASVGKKANLNLNLESALPAIEGDATQLRQMLMNLVTNASEAIGEEPGVVGISMGARDCKQEDFRGMLFEEAMEEGLYLCAEVKDTGCGMSHDTLQRIFEPFFTTKFTGRGLGMAAVLGIVRGHKGAIRIQSKPAHGTTITLLFPARSAPLGDSRETPELENAEWTANGGILLIDDEPQVLTLGRRMLERLGFEVFTASNGREAVETYLNHRENIALVLLDLAMPNMDGGETLCELRLIDPSVQVILSSSFTEHEIAGQFADQGIIGFLQKPYTISTLRDCIRSATALGKEADYFGL